MTSDPQEADMAFNGAQHWAQQQAQHQTQQDQRYGASQHFQNYQQNQLNPSVPGFQPNGTEMQRFQSPLPTPPPSVNKHDHHPATNDPDMQQMQRFVLDNHFTHTKEVAGLERQTHKNSKEIKSTQEIVRRDMRALQDQIGELRTLVKDQKVQAGMLAPRHRQEQDLAVTDQFLENFSKDRIAEAYLEEAEDFEKAAAKLREQVEDLSFGVSTRKLVTLKMLDAPDGARTEAQFACCGSTFISVKQMLEHVDGAHGLREDLEHAESEERSLVLDGGADGTPTHVPPRKPTRVQQESRAVEIKAPVEADDNTQSTVNEQPDHGHHIEEPIDGTPKNLEIKQAVPAETRSTWIQTDTTNEKWQPLAVRQMPPPPTLSIASTNTETFTWEFLKLTLGGEQWSPGFYFISQDSILPSKAYWILDADTEPYLPAKPGEHGAKLTAFFNTTPSEEGSAPEEENYIDAPVFVRPEGKSEYVYFVNYSQPRFSDKLDYDRVLDTVPEKIRLYWAEQLASQERPEWVTKALTDHFWPKPAYEGPIPTADTGDRPSDVLEKRVSRALDAYALELKTWEKDARMKVQLLTAGNLMLAFGKADADEEPGLRLWWEYLQCVGFDQGFYEMLVAFKGDEMGRARAGDSRKVGMGKGGKTVKGTDGVETVKQDTPPAVARKAEKGLVVLAKPWEDGDAVEEPKRDGEKEVVNGDMDVAKKLQEDFKKGGRSSHKNGNGNAVKATYLAPHLRAKAGRN